MMVTRETKSGVSEEKRMRILQLITVAAVILFVLLITALITNLVRLAASNSRKEQLEAQLAALDARIETNAGIIEYRKSWEYVDAYAREYLNMIGRDEEAFTGK